MDIRLITTDITLLHKFNPRADPQYNYHATVGGCAIMTFGSLAHITFPTKFLDPSGAGTFIGAKLQTHSALPPIFLNALYLFPPSPGPTTLNSRIETYLRQHKSTETPIQWQRTIITQMLQAQYDSAPDCSQIVGGDFNHRNWSDLNHPVTNTFLNELHLSNPAYSAYISSCENIPQPVTYLPKGHGLTTSSTLVAQKSPTSVITNTHLSRLILTTPHTPMTSIYTYLLNIIPYLETPPTVPWPY